jgi:RNA polymerase sigma-70 factor (ECF subfamily)
VGGKAKARTLSGASASATDGAAAVRRATTARIAFVERIESGVEQAEDLDTARCVARFQAGEAKQSFAVLYDRYFDRVYGYLRVLLKDSHAAEDATQSVFLHVFEALARYERRSGRPFRAWLFTIVRNEAFNRVRRSDRIDFVDPAELNSRSEPVDSENGELGFLAWASDSDLYILIERLPLAQRQVLMLRYHLDLSSAQIAEILGRTPETVRKLQSRAQRHLRDRLVARGRRPERRGERPCAARIPEAVVLRARRFSLH